ncbi:MAG: hypothetical protein M1812_001589 [Candelaria pacifica]|nr:MAG: hypothetical protein M1812_001589 [Candelaria pacifica]
MAFSFGGPQAASNNAFGGNMSNNIGGQNQTGPDLEEIQTEAVGFKSLAGESKIRLLPAPWPSDALPPPTSSLLSIASNKGLIAAGGPDSLVIASTESVRQAFTSDGPAGSDIKPFSPQLTIPLGTRLSQVAFSADEKYLVVSAESGGGLAVYEVDSIMQGNSQTTFELSTDGAALRALIPNPTAETAELFAIITTSGQLMMANLTGRKFIAGPNGYVLKDGVSCASWSTKGKQLVAGLGNGTGYQMTPEGEGKAEIPRPQALEGDKHVSSISWLENNVFLMVHTPSSFDAGTNPESTYHIITRTIKPQLSHMSQKLPDPCPPFGLNRSPPYQFILRLKEFKPNLQDLLIVSSTASSDIGLFTRSKSALTSDVPAEQIMNVFTTTSMAEDSRRATLSMTEDMSDTSTIGLAFDLSAKEKVIRPIPGEEMETSPTPLPGLMDLNHEGVLAAWWVVYSESIRQGIGYDGLVAIGGTQQPQTAPIPSQPQTSQQASPFGSTVQPQKAAFGQPALGGSSPAAGAFGGSPTPSNGPAGAFGAPSGLGNRQSPWGSAGGFSAAQTGGAAFGKPAFGSSTPLGGASQGAAFGATGGMGIRQSPWGTPAATLSPSPTASSFGQPSAPGPRPTSSFGGASSGGTFGATNPSTTPTSGSGGFGSYAASGGFAATAVSQTAAAPAASSGFGKGGSFSNVPNAVDTRSIFGGAANSNPEPKSGVFGSGTSGFSLGSTFKGDGTAKDDAPRPGSEGGGGFFGSGFSNALGDTQKTPATPQTKEADMKGDSNGNETPANDRQQQLLGESTTPASTPAPAKSLFPATAAPATGGMFGTQAQSHTTPAEVQASKPVAIPASTNPQIPGTAPPVFGGLFGTQSQSKVTPAAVQNSSPAIWSFGQLKDTNEPPESSSSRGDDAPGSPAPFPPSPKIKPEPAQAEGHPSGVDSTIPAAPLRSNTPIRNTNAAASSSGSTHGTSRSVSNHSNEDAPLPPDFMPAKGTVSRSEETEPVLPSDDENDELFEEGSGEDVAQDISPTTDPSQSPKITPESSFGVFDRSPVGGSFTKVSRQPPQQSSNSLFGEIGNKSGPIFPPPSKIQESPRSPSPVRSAVPQDVLRPDNSRSVSAPNTATMSGGLPTMKQAKAPAAALDSAKSKRQPTTAQASNYAPSLDEQRKQQRDRLAKLEAQKQAQEEQDLSDNDDERVREELATDVEGMLVLESFLAHQDYIGHINKPGIAGQIEKVYRDINSMIDTLGLNARSLKAFIKGHQENYKETGERTRDDLELDDWCLIETEDLAIVEKLLGDQLKHGRVKDLPSKLEQCSSIAKDLAKTRAKQTDIRKIIDSHNRPDDTERLAPLSSEQAAQQHEIRKALIDVQKLLAEAEEGITMLSTKIASSNNSNGGANGKNGTGRPAAPTVEAVMNTIVKMTNMVEKRSGDIDVLENQMRKIRLGSVASNSGGESREASPFTTPLSSRSLTATSRNLGASIGSVNGTPSKKMSGVTDDDVSRLLAKRQRKKEVGRLVREALTKAGPRLRVMDDV